MPVDIVKNENRVKALQALQKQRLNSRKFSELPQEFQIDYCRTRKELGKLAYQCYQAMKEAPDLSLLAAQYFLLAESEYCHHQAIEELEHACSRNARDSKS